MTRTQETETMTSAPKTLADFEAELAARISAAPPPEPRVDTGEPQCAQCGCYGPVGDGGLCHSCRTYAQRQQDRIDDCRDSTAASGAQASGAWCRRCGGPVADGSGICGEC